MGPLGVTAAHDSHVFWLSCVAVDAPGVVSGPLATLLRWEDQGPQGGSTGQLMAVLTALGSESQELPGLEMHFSNLYFKVNAGQASLVCLHYILMSARKVG